MSQSSVGPPWQLKQASLLQSTLALQLRTANDTQTLQQSTEQLSCEKIWRFVCAWLGQARATAERMKCQRTCACRAYCPRGVMSPDSRLREALRCAYLARRLQAM